MALTAKGILVRQYGPDDHSDWIAMRTALWPKSSEADSTDWMARHDAVTLLAEDVETGTLVGFVEVGKRLYADGCYTSPVAFLEGWYVSPEMRGKGIGLKLVQASKSWAKQEHLHELASDSLIDDNTAHLAHLSVGFQEVERSVK
jgi:aminoglycoside 6'-N-acetyltransferase I